ncbi:hypothetical protein CI105_08395 [Candidatus Izimaplasma bacterium ZiA1]|uniref:SIR2 family protein n=1 Tax=Candidatus Izimoplasma sp. ZiA1 TaxID=2024899 RepID=UPI000BAA6147|nr:hypothetical protein CI105_08395 [Candidatus Izimaplasma bacterium ZiA1]
MDKQVKAFIKNYSEFIMNDEASLFIGAGISIGSGYVNWKELLTEIADEIGLDIDEEDDLIELAQFHKNENDSRELLNKKLIKEFTRDVVSNKTHNLLSEMEIDEYWTSNYDTLLEDTFKNDGFNVEAKRSTADLARKYPRIDKTVYKMHGDIGSPENAVLVKDDYETYSVKWKDFSLLFQSALIKKTFLFIGFSFDDPNLKYLLGRIKMLMGEDARKHYCIMKRVNVSDCEHIGKDFEYETIKQKLKIADLKRYSIKVLLIDEFEELNDILLRINQRVKYNRIFISGAANTYAPFTQTEVEKFSYDLSWKLVNSDNQITSGFGLGIGSSVINAGLEYVFQKKKSIDDVIKMRPFPQNIDDEKERQELWKRYRYSMLKNVGVAVFMFGNKVKRDEIVFSDGMQKEFDICIELGIKVIPLPFTGYISNKLYQDIILNTQDYYPDLCENPRFISKFNELSKVSSLDDYAISVVNDLINFIKRSSIIEKY